MNIEEKANLRLAVLKVLDANRSKFGLNIDAITLRLTPFGFDRVTGTEVETVMPHLKEEKMIDHLNSPLTPGVKVWKITDEGRSFLAENF